VGSTYIITVADSDQYYTTVQTTVGSQKLDPTTGVTTTGTLSDDATVAYTNKVSYGKLVITKKVLDVNDNIDGDWSKEFTFKVSLKYHGTDTAYTGEVFVEQNGTRTTVYPDKQGNLTITKVSYSSPATLLFTEDVTYEVVEDLTGTVNYALYSSSNTQNFVTVGRTKTAAFTNKYYGMYKGVYVAKVWKGGDNTSSKDPVTVQIYRNGEPYEGSFPLKSTVGFGSIGSTSWTNGFTRTLNTYEDGKKIVYTVEETNVPSGYTVSYSDMETDANGYCRLTVTNTKGTSLTLEKLVSGSAASKDEEFGFSIILYDENNQQLDGTYTVTSGVVDGTGATKPDITDLTFNAKEAASKVFKLKHGQKITIEGLPENYSYMISEIDGDSYTRTVSASTGTYGVQDRVIVGANGGNNVTVTYTNTKNITVPTGINLNWWPFAVAGILAAAGLAVLIWRNHKKRSE
jgi:hypothetical protein